MSELPPLHHFWGKIGRRKEFDGRYHPLLCHMADVGAVAEAVWDEVLSPAARCAWAASLDLPDEASARGWIALIAALHDVGKGCASFQRQQSGAPLASLLADMPPLAPAARYAPHGVVTALDLPGVLRERCGIESLLAKQIGKITGGHHGAFPTPTEMAGPPGWRNDPALGGPKWQRARAAVAAEILDAFGAAALPLPRTIDNATAMALAGFISVMDWIGSDERFFPYAGRVETDGSVAPLDLAAYLGGAREKARMALSRLYWTGWTPQHEPKLFTDLFPFANPPRPLQVATVAVAEELATPALVLIEAPMGEGKTEAALYLADRWGVAPGPRGCYLALPTQATSNQMFQRLEDFLRRRYRDQIVNVNLLHGRAALSTDLRELRERAAHPDDLIINPGMTLADDDLWDDDEGRQPGRLVAGEWFTGSKRGLLTPFGTGTVDQALLAVLQTQHQFVRLFGLAHKVVVIDEVHAYDAYMSTLLERLLGWLAALGSPVVLLSATLPATRRRALLAAYARGLGIASVETDTTEAYPRISWIDRSGAGEAACVASPESQRVVALRWVGANVEGEGGLGAQLRDALAEGGCAAVICNTVRRAQDVYEALHDHFAAEELGLFHARFRFIERDAIEKATLQRFGKPVANPDRPHRFVLVATQVIEQSLDLDFDLMVSEVAPADLVLQRAGRLHRHAGRSRPAALATPQLWLCRPKNDAEARAGAAPIFADGSTQIYDAHVLLRSWLALRDCDAVSLPDEIPALVERVYGDETTPVALSDAERSAWDETLRALKQARADAELQARSACILPVDQVSLETLLNDRNRRLEEDAPDMHRTLRALTRITEESVTVVVLTEEEARGFNPKRRPTAAQTEWLLARSVTVSNRRVVYARDDRALPSPEGWAKVGMLRGLRLALLDGERRCQPPGAGYTLRLDERRGLLVE